MMDEWEARYRALAAGITDQAMVANAERIVESATRIASHTAQTFDEIMYALLQAVAVQNTKHDALTRFGHRGAR